MSQIKSSSRGGTGQQIQSLLLDAINRRHQARLIDFAPHAIEARLERHSRADHLCLLFVLQPNVGNLELRRAGIAEDFERFVSRSQVRRPGDREVVIIVDRIHRDVIRNAASRISTQVTGDCHPIRKHRLELVRSVRIACQHLQRSRRMPTSRVSHRPQQRVLVRDLRQPRQQLADLNARHVRVDRLIRPAKLRRCQRLRIERFEMTGPTSQPNEDHSRAFVVSDVRQAGPSLFGGRSQVQKLTERQAAEPRQPKAQEFAPSDARSMLGHVQTPLATWEMFH